jgi:hypothetical protein
MTPKGKRYAVAPDGTVVVTDRPTPPPTPITLTPDPMPTVDLTHPSGRPIGHYL